VITGRYISNTLIVTNAVYDKIVQDASDSGHLLYPFNQEKDIHKMTSGFDDEVASPGKIFVYPNSVFVEDGKVSFSITIAFERAEWTYDNPIINKTDIDGANNNISIDEYIIMLMEYLVDTFNNSEFGNHVLYVTESSVEAISDGSGYSNFEINIQPK
jgi:hypothetical protein